MHKIRTWLILFFSIITSLLYAQNAVVKGVVKSQSTGSSLLGVTVIDENNNNGTITDSAGSYELNLPAGKHTLSFKYIGFTEKKVSVELVESQIQKLDVSLSEATSELGTVVVSASKFEQRIEDVTVSMEVIKPAMVENRNTTSADEILDQVPGVNVIDGQANIRGGAGWSYGAGSRVMVLVDDLPELSADAGDAKWEFIPLENLSQMEVIKGASSALFGSSALDGVVNFRTAYPGDKPLTKANVFSGVYDTPDPSYLKWWGNQTQVGYGANFFHSRRINNFDLVLGGNFLKNEGYREGEHEERFRFNGNFRYRFKSIEGLSAGVNFNHMKTTSALFFIWQNDTTGALRPLGGLDPDTTTLSQSIVYRTTVDPFITYIDRKGNSVKLLTRWFNTINENNTNQNSTGNVYYSELQYQRHFSNQLTFTAGAVENYSTVKAQLYGDHNSNNFAFFAQGDAKWNRFTFSLGARAEHYRTDTVSEKITPVVRTGVNYHAAKATYLRASFGQGYRVPSIAEKFVETNVGGFTIFPNDSLKSEKGFSTEIGIKQGLKFGKWLGFLDVAGFWTQYYNMIEFVFAQWQPFTSQNPGFGFSARNVGDTRVKGIDISISGTGEISHGLTATVLAGYTYMDPKQLTYDSTYIAKVGSGYKGTDSSDFLKYRFNHMFNGDVELDYKKVSLGVSVRYTSFMKNIDKIFIYAVPGLEHYRETHMTGDAILDLRAACQITNALKISFIVKNALNREYMGRPADIQPPRNYTLQLAAIF